VFEVNLIEALLMWARSIEGWLRIQDVTVSSGNSPDDVMRRSAWVTIRRGDKEAELILWESGEAEFGSSDARVKQLKSTMNLAALAISGPC
jgi:hypothetical protein